MKFVKIDGARELGRPEGWDEERDGVCVPLPVFDATDDKGRPWIGSAWEPEPDELERLKAGNPLYVWILGPSHPVLNVSVGLERAAGTGGGPMVWSRNVHHPGDVRSLDLVARVGDCELHVQGPPPEEAGELALVIMFRELADQLEAAAAARPIQAVAG
jgi:hypothetical protein